MEKTNTELEIVKNILLTQRDIRVLELCLTMVERQVGHGSLQVETQRLKQKLASGEER